MKSETIEVSIRNNPAESRFETEVDGQLAVCQYLIKGDKIFFIHTEVPGEVEGRGIGLALAKEALEYAKRENLRVVPRCRFIAAFIEQNPEYQSLVEEQPGD